MNILQKRIDNRIKKTFYISIKGKIDKTLEGMVMKEVDDELPEDEDRLEDPTEYEEADDDAEEDFDSFEEADDEVY